MLVSIDARDRAGCHELRCTDASKTWRVMYAIDEDAMAVLDVFAKKG